ncbi:hypothetical protein SRHO_G00019440 [Serrasalmus rhombeus]
MSTGFPLSLSTDHHPLVSIIKKNLNEMSPRIQRLIMKLQSPLAKDDVVQIQDQDAWNRKATVLQEVGPRSYEVKTEEGHVLRRNRHSLLKTKETFTETEKESNAFSADAASNADNNGHLHVHTSNVQSELPVLRRSGHQKKKRPDRLDL